MFLRKVTKKHGKKTYQYAFIVENVRQDGRVLQKYVKNLGPIESEKDWSRAQELFEKTKLGDELLSLNDLGIERNEEYGSIIAVKKIWDSIGADTLFSRFSREIFCLVANRLSSPVSENKAIEWLKNDAYVEGKEKIKLHNLYRALDFLAENKEVIEKGVFERLGLGAVKIVFYDLTSSYFESRSDDELRKFGYSRDKKKGKRQIVIGLVLADGLPIAHFTFPGNTPDRTTLQSTVTYLAGMGVKECVFVADRGLISSENLEFLEENGEKYVLATKRRGSNFIKKIMQNETTSAKEVFQENGIRYILCFSKERQEADLERLEFEIREFKENTLKNRKKAQKTWGNKPAIKRLFDENFTFNNEAYEYEKKIAGKFLLATNTILPAEECEKSYRQLAEIERNFREIKSFVKLRPFYHRDQNRIRAHVFVCVLALLIEKLMEKKLDGMSVRQAFCELKRLRVSICKINGKEVGIVNEPTASQQKIFSLLGIEKPLKVV